MPRKKTPNTGTTTTNIANNVLTEAALRKAFNGVYYLGYPELLIQLQEYYLTGETQQQICKYCGTSYTLTDPGYVFICRDCVPKDKELSKPYCELKDLILDITS